VDSAKHGGERSRCAQPARASSRRRGSPARKGWVEGELPAVFCYLGTHRSELSQHSGFLTHINTYRKDGKDRKYASVALKSSLHTKFILEPNSKRTPVRLRHKIEKASAAKQRKDRRAAKKVYSLLQQKRLLYKGGHT
jgi:hypothetical protein